MTITVAPMPPVLTLLEAMIVPVILDTLGMASHVMVCFCICYVVHVQSHLQCELLGKLCCHLYYTLIFYMLLFNRY